MTGDRPPQRASTCHVQIEETRLPHSYTLLPDTLQSRARQTVIPVRSRTLLGHGGRGRMWGRKG